MKTGADEWILRDLTVTFRSQFRLVSAILDCVAAFVALRFSHPQGTSRSRFNERIRAVDQANAWAVINPQRLAERNSLLESFRRISKLAQHIVGVFELLLLRSELLLLVGNSLAAMPRFIELRETDIERAKHRKNNDGEENDLSARIDFANQFASELAEKDLGVIASRGGRSLHRRLLNERRDVSTAPAAGDHRRSRVDGKEMNRRSRGANPNFISVIDALVWLD